MLSWQQGNNYGTNFITRHQIIEKPSLLHTDRSLGMEFTEMIERHGVRRTNGSSVEVIKARGSIKAQLEMDHNAPQRRSAFHMIQKN
jgi:hypothetical protein